MAACQCVEVNTENFTMVSLNHYVVRLSARDEVTQLLMYLGVLEFQQVVVYVNNAPRCTTLTTLLLDQGFSATSIHEVMPQQVRLDRLAKFKEMEDANILVTSCCGHAMHFKNVDVVIMFDEAVNPIVYSHRLSSRRARKGLVINFVRKDEYMAVIQQIEKQYKISIPPLPVELYTSSYLQTIAERESSTPNQPR